MKRWLKLRDCIRANKGVDWIFPWIDTIQHSKH